MAINKVIVIGNLGPDPVVRPLANSGQNVANFSLGTTERFTDRNGSKQERTEWLRVVAFGRLADTWEPFLSKGRQVYVEGRLSTANSKPRTKPEGTTGPKSWPGKSGFSRSARTAPTLRQPKKRSPSSRQNEQWRAAKQRLSPISK